jgi:hypothetical protein
VFLLALLPASSVLSQTLVVSSTGKQYLLQEDAAGNLALYPIKRVIRMDGSDPGNGGPVDPPPQQTELSRSVTNATLAIYDTEPKDQNDPTTAQGISLAYRKVAKAVGDGKIPPAEAWPALKEMTDDVLDFQNATNRWRPWRQEVGRLLNDARDDGSLDDDDKDSVAKILTEVELGLTTANAGMALNWDRIFQILERIIEKILDKFLERWIGGAGQGAVESPETIEVSTRPVRWWSGRPDTGNLASHYGR